MSATTSAPTARSTATAAPPPARTSSTVAAPIPDAPPTTATRRSSRSAIASDLRADPRVTRGAQQLDERVGERHVGLEHHRAVSALLLWVSAVAATHVANG